MQSLVQTRRHFLLPQGVCLLSNLNVSYPSKIQALNVLTTGQLVHAVYHFLLLIDLEHVLTVASQSRANHINVSTTTLTAYISRPQIINFVYTCIYTHVFILYARYPSITALQAQFRNSFVQCQSTTCKY